MIRVLLGIVFLFFGSIAAGLIYLFMKLSDYRVKDHEKLGI